MTAGFDGTVGVAGKKHRQVVMRVPIAIADGAAVHNHAVVQQCAVAFLDALEAIQKMRKLKNNAAFTIQAADLRLPGELLKLRRRREQGASQRDLEKIAESLSRGKVEQARRELKIISAQ